ncbi:P-loop ATPase, Sll1717 family [Faecalibacterium prausnitzii]|jgi:hypothetical protein|uniref:P-loop ATPase, Sll1717 family n=1 Tax=Faecalibacterium prausnitzii TaxID=853 RepID=UPI0022E212FD|nr:hypothetical protein [Faecalibacterium prausnitzii]
MGSTLLRFSDIDWGEDEAKNDYSLERYFVEFPGFNNVLTGKKRFIVGRKGTGKTAILQKIRLQDAKNPTIFSVDIALRDFPLNDFRSLGDRSLQDKSKYVAAWKFILLTELAGMIIKDESIERTPYTDALRDFMNRNFPNGISVTNTIERLRKNENKIALAVSILSGNLSSSQSEQEVAQVHYNKAVKTLEEILKGIVSDSTYYELIDELDEGYNSDSSNLNSVILALLRASDEVYHSFKSSGIRFIPITALRSDIFDNLEDNDLNKLDDYVLRLNWTTDENSAWSLKQIAERRIAATLEKSTTSQNSGDYWSLVADNASTEKGLWQYLCILTFSRPRDIIKILKYCSEEVSSQRLTLTDVQRAEERYSDWFYREFRDEVQSFMPCWKGALNCISEIARGKEKVAILIERLKGNNEVSKWCSDNGKEPLDVIKILFNYSVIGCINESGRWIFKYKDDYFEYMASYPYYCVHYGFCRKLRINKRYNQEIIEAYRSYK